MKRLLTGTVAGLLATCLCLSASASSQSVSAASWQYEEHDDLVEGWVEASRHRLAIGCDIFILPLDFFRLDTPQQVAAGDTDRMKTRDPKMIVAVDGQERTLSVTPMMRSDGTLIFEAEPDDSLYEALAAASRRIEVTITLSSPSEVLAKQRFTARNASSVVPDVRYECDDETW